MPNLGTKIVLVTADAAMARIAVAHLEEAGFKVTTVKNPIEALKKIREDPPHLVLADAGLPGAGDRLLANLKRTPGVRDVPVAVLSLRAEASDRLTAIRSGATYFLDKSIEPGDLVRRIRRIMGDRVGDSEPELRVLPRLTMTVPVRIKRLRGRKEKAVSGQIRDLSGAGISFYSPADFDKGETLELEFAPRDEKAIRTFMEVVWRRVSGDGYLVACKYLAEHPGDIDAVQRFVTKKK